MSVLPRATAVTFSDSYYDVQQAIVALKGSPIVANHTPASLKTYVYGDQVGTTGLSFISTKIQPTAPPKVFDTLSEVSAALEAHRVAALITDTPTAQYMASFQLKHAVLVAQFPPPESTMACCSTWATHSSPVSTKRSPR